MAVAPKSIKGPTAASPAVAIARLGILSSDGDQVADSDWVNVHFNPSSLQLQVSNELKTTKNNERSQYIAKTSAKLTMELQFDTTDSGNDVTETTGKIQAFVSPKPPARQPAARQPPPPTVLFEWGRMKFRGIAESYKETVDFFSASGVPLRASVNLTLSRQDRVFDDAAGGGPADLGARDTAGALNAGPRSAADVANAGGSPDAARLVGATNGQENLRFSAGASLTVSAGISLQAPAAFASGGGLSPGGGLDPGAGLDIGAGVSALARLPAAEGAFAGLRAVAESASSLARLDPSRLLPQVRSATLSTDRNASFEIGGKATLEGTAGLRADVGASGGFGGKLTFD